MVKHDSWKKKEDLENVKEVVVEFEGRMNAEVRRQKKLEIVKEKDFRKRKLLRKFIVKMLYRWDDGKFKNEYLKRLKRNQEKWKEKDKIIWGDKISSFGSRNLKEKIMSNLQSLDPSFF